MPYINPYIAKRCVRGWRPLVPVHPFHLGHPRGGA
jgi:hypothetical protein